MIPRALQRDRHAGWTFIFSLSIHIFVIFIFNNTDLFRTPLHESAPYYVDIVSLPALDPASTGSEPVPSSLPSAAIQPAAAQKPALSLPEKLLPSKPAMALPEKQLPSKPAVSSTVADQELRDQEAREFNERMNRLEHGSDARHRAEALASLQKRAADKRGTGGSPASGIDKGSDYGAYIQSRLQDVLSSTIVFRSQKPEAAVHIYIDKTGKLIRYVMIRPSADKLFNNSVIRTIEKAKADFPPVPTGASFDRLYVFSPQEVKK